MKSPEDAKVREFQELAHTGSIGSGFENKQSVFGASVISI